VAPNQALLVAESVSAPNRFTTPPLVSAARSGCVKAMSAAGVSMYAPPARTVSESTPFR
jgi:hypothetical protein